MSTLDWRAGQSKTGRLVHAVRMGRHDNDTGETWWKTACGRDVPVPRLGPWADLNEDIICCSSCLDLAR